MQIESKQVVACEASKLQCCMKILTELTLRQSAEFLNVGCPEREVAGSEYSVWGAIAVASIHRARRTNDGLKS